MGSRRGGGIGGGRGQCRKTQERQRGGDAGLQLLSSRRRGTLGSQGGQGLRSSGCHDSVAGPPESISGATDSSVQSKSHLPDRHTQPLLTTVTHSSVRPPLSASLTPTVP